jgi:hypothetical protein
MTGASAFTARELEREARREVQMREHVYAKTKHGATRGARDRQLAMMRQIAEHFKQIADTEDAQERLI